MGDDGNLFPWYFYMSHSAVDLFYTFTMACNQSVFSGYSAFGDCGVVVIGFKWHSIADSSIQEK
jgi:hypothetical protein